VAATKKQHPTLVRIRNHSDASQPAVFEHVCDKNAARGRRDFCPKIMWLRSYSSNDAPQWCLCHRDHRIPIVACCFCGEKLTHPFGYVCNCGAEEARLHRGYSSFVVQKDLHDFRGKPYPAKVRATVLEFLHDPTCPAARFKEEDGNPLF
jgi:hypothetical protein